MKITVTQDEFKIVHQIAESVNKIGGRTFYVGDCVRNEELGIDITRLDIEIFQITLDELKDILSKYDYQIDMKDDFNIYKIKETSIGISLPIRADCLNIDKEKIEQCIDPDASYFDNCAKRGLSINSMMKNVLSGQIIDLFKAREDIKNKVIKCTDDNIFIYNPINIIKAIRLCCELGFAIEEHTKSLCSKVDISNINAAHIASEVDKALLSNNPALFFRLMTEFNLTDYWFRELWYQSELMQKKEQGLENLFEHTLSVITTASYNKNKVKNSKQFMLAALCHDFGKAIRIKKNSLNHIGHEVESANLAERFLKRLNYDEFTIKFVKDLCLMHMEPGILWRYNSSNKKIIAMLDKTEFPEEVLLLKHCDLECPKDGNDLIVQNKFNYSDWCTKALNIYSNWLKMPHLNEEDLSIAKFDKSKMQNILSRARRLEMANDFISSLKQLGSEFKIPKKTIETIIFNKKIDDEDREAKLLNIYQKNGLCLKLKNASIKEIIIEADKELMLEFDESGRYNDEYYDFLEERIGKFASKHKDLIEKTIDSQNKTR